eukprot:GEMP01027342.1.p1 GENE.GEMP01027342.1~~GEMP01027342.1.p1  ORF type:complete len:369 (+),score=73.02 GEMP01027342.1:95-1201(+)
MAALDESFPRFTKAMPAALDRADCNGAVLDLYSFRQLEFLSPAALRQRAMEVEHQYQKAGMDTPLRTPAHSNEELIHWIMVCQAYFVDGEIKKETLLRFGARTSMSWMEAVETRIQAHVKRASTLQAPYAPEAISRREQNSTLKATSKDSVIHDAVSRGIGHGKRHIERADHDCFGVPHKEDDKMVRHSKSKDSVVCDHLSRGLGHGRRHIPEPQYDDSGVLIQDGEGNALDRGSPFRLGMNPRDENREASFKHGGIKDGIGHEERYIGCKDHLRHLGEDTDAHDGVEFSKVGVEGKRHIRVLTSMLNMGTSDDVSGKRNETIPGQGHGMKHVDRFFTTPIAEKGQQQKYTTTWRRDPSGLSGSSMGI